MARSEEDVFKVSPSDLSFAWDDCRRCLWRKWVLGLRAPSKPMPSIFTAIDKLMKGLYDGKSTAAIPAAEPLPEGTISVGREFVRSETIGTARGKPVVISGKKDAWIKFAGPVGIIDFKTSRVMPEYVPKYGRQLHAYGWCLERPTSGRKAQRVLMLGLLCWAPDKAGAVGGKGEEALAQQVGLHGAPSWIEVPIDWDGFAKTLGEIVALIDGKEPKPGPGCEWCAWDGTKRSDA